MFPHTKICQLCNNIGKSRFSVLQNDDDDDDKLERADEPNKWTETSVNFYTNDRRYHINDKQFL